MFKALDYVLAGSGTGIGIGIGIGAGGKSTEEEDKGDGCMKHILPEPTVVKWQEVFCKTAAILNNMSWCCAKKFLTRGNGNHCEGGFQNIISTSVCIVGFNIRD